MGVVEHESSLKVQQLLNTTGVDLILSDLLNNRSGGGLEQAASLCSRFIIYYVLLF